MGKRLVIGALVLGVLFLGLLGWQQASRAVEALPGNVRARLPETVLRAVTTPLPTALPAPSAAAEVALTLPPLAAPSEAPVTTVVVSTSAASDTAVPQPTAVPPAASPSATVTPMLPGQTRLSGLTIAPQKLNNCGPTNLSINLQFYGLETTQFDVAEVVKPNYDDRNVSPEELVAYVNHNTPLEAAVYRGGDLELLKRLIASGYPVVIEKGYAPDWQGWMGHYLTIYGYDDAQQAFITMDTFQGPWDSSGRSYRYADIQANWSHFNFTFFVVYPRQDAATIAALLPNHMAEPVAMWAHAARSAERATQSTPDNAFAWFNLGSSLTHLGHLTGAQELYVHAAAAFDQARLLGLPPRMLWYQFEPYQAYLAAGRVSDVLILTDTILADFGGRNVEETYYYRGRALLTRGDTDGATEMWRRALRLKPENSAVEAALDALLATPVHTNQ